VPRQVGEAIGQMLPSAVGVAISPLPIVAVVLTLVTARGRVNGPAFLVGWWVGIAVVGAIVLAVAKAPGATDEGEPATWVSWLELILGVLLLLVALKQWRSRPQGDTEPEMPKWMKALDTFTPPKAAGGGVVLSALNPKNLLLTVAGATAIAQAGISGGQQAVALVVFILIASLGVAAPIVIYFALGERAGPLLERLKNWLAQNNAVIMAVLLVIIGVKLIGDGISGLF
jgi:threonine/homoserine/homoserine lactone efflux protein